MILTEGLKEGDLEDLVIPLVNIDEYETKLDDDAIVIAFFVKDRDPASDLNRFIQKGSTGLLDTEVSPAPNEDGYYVVFVELVRNKNFPERVMEILDSLKGLTLITKWRGQFYDHDGVHDITLDNLTRLVRLEPNHDDQDVEDLPDDSEDIEESLYEFFRPSILDDLNIKTNQYHSIVLEFTRLGRTSEYMLVDIGEIRDLKERNEVLNQAFRLDEEAQSNVTRIQHFLGMNWLVEHLEDHVLISNHESNKVALLRV